MVTLKCDGCGQFVSYDDIGAGRAIYELVYPDSEYTCETFETVCEKCLTPKETEYLNSRKGVRGIGGVEVRQEKRAF